MDKFDEIRNEITKPFGGLRGMLATLERIERNAIAKHDSIELSKDGKTFKIKRPKPYK